MSGSLPRIRTIIGLEAKDPTSNAEMRMPACPCPWSLVLGPRRAGAVVILVVPCRVVVPLKTLFNLRAAAWHVQRCSSQTCALHLFSFCRRHPKGRDYGTNRRETERETVRRTSEGYDAGRGVGQGGVGNVPYPGSRVASGCPCHVPLVANFTALSLTMIFGRRRAHNAGGHGHTSAP